MKDEKYIVTEALLLNYLLENDSYEDVKNILIPQLIKNGSLTPVTEIASGEVGFCTNGYTLNGKLLTDLFDKDMSKNVYKNIEMYIREVINE